MEIPRLVVDRDIAKKGDSMQSFFGMEEDVFSSDDVRNFLDENRDAPKIEIEIACDGGSTSETKICFDLLIDSGKTITTLGYKVNSAAVVLFLAGSERLLSTNCEPIIHPIWVDPSGLPFKMEADDMIEFGEEMKAEEEKLVNIYCEVIGEDKRKEVVDLMEKSTALDTETCLRLGFATGMIEPEKQPKENKRAVTFSKKMAALVMNSKKQKQDTMKTFAETLNSVKADLVRLLKRNKDTDGDPVNASTELASGDTMWYDGELATDTAVFSDDAMSEKMADGDHELKDGRIVTVVDGIVTAIADAPDPQDKAVDLTEVNATIEEIKAEAKKTNEKIDGVLEAVQNLVTGLKDFKNIIPGGTRGVVKEPKPTVKAYADMTNKEKMIYNKEH